MTDKKFNTYNDFVDLQSLRTLFTVSGNETVLQKGDYFVRAGDVSLDAAYVIDGYFHYICHGRANRKYITGFAFSGEFVADYPRCLYDIPSDVDIVAATRCTILRLTTETLTSHFNRSKEETHTRIRLSDSIFLQTYKTLHDMYTMSPEERYVTLLRRCPDIVQQISLKELASFLRVTPTTVSTIRRKQTFFRR